MIDMVTLLRKHRVLFEGPNRRGWLMMTCPKCGKPYLGWNVDSQVFFCWFDRAMPFLKTLSQLLHMSLAEAWKVAEQHRSKHTKRRIVVSDDGIERPTELVWPTGIGDITSAHAKYLTSRRLDPDEIINQWHILGTSGLAEALYANRIFAPLEFNGEPVSWQGRSIMKSNTMRYVTCPDASEVVPSKKIVYGWDYVEDGTAVIVEGLFDVWKGGKGCVHSFGIAWTPAQLFLLSKLKYAVVAFDYEPQAQRSAELLAESLDGMGVVAGVLRLDQKDFGSMPKDEAAAIVKEAMESCRKGGEHELV